MARQRWSGSALAAVRRQRWNGASLDDVISKRWNGASLDLIGPPSLTAGPVPILTVAATSATASTTTVPVTLLPSYTVGDLVTVFIDARAATPTFTAITGWTFTRLSTGSGQSLWVCTKVSDGTEGGTTVTFTLSTAVRWNAIAARVQITSGVGVIGTASVTLVSATGQTNTAPSITTDSANNLLVAFQGLATGDTSATTKDAAMAWANGSGVYATGALTTSITSWIATESRPTAGVTGSRTATATLNTAASVSFQGVLLAFKPQFT